MRVSGRSSRSSCISRLRWSRLRLWRWSSWIKSKRRRRSKRFLRRIRKRSSERESWRRLRRRKEESGSEAWSWRRSTEIMCRTRWSLRKKRRSRKYWNLWMSMTRTCSRCWNSSRRRCEWRLRRSSWEGKREFTMWRRSQDSKNLRSSSYWRKFRNKLWRLRLWSCKKKICSRRERWLKLKLKCRRKLWLRNSKRWKNKEKLTWKRFRSLVWNHLRVWATPKDMILSQGYLDKAVIIRIIRCESRTKESLQVRMTRLILLLRNQWRNLKRSLRAREWMRFKLITNLWESEWNEGRLQMLNWEKRME